MLLDPDIVSNLFNQVQSSDQQVSLTFTKVVQKCSEIELTVQQQKSLINSGLYNCVSLLIGQDTPKGTLSFLTITMNNLIQCPVIMTDFLNYPSFFLEIINLGLQQIPCHDQDSHLLATEVLYIICTVMTEP